jgi:tetratricopeptide (TPR) repeat protein
MFDFHRSEALAAFKVGKLEDCAELCRRGMALAEAQGEENQRWRLLTQLSLCLSFQGKFTEAIAILEEQPFTETVSTEIRARVLNQKGHVLSRAGKFQPAKEHLDEALRLATEAALPQLAGEIQINRQTHYFYLTKYDEVEKCARAALAISEEHHLRLVEASACAGMAKSAMYTSRQAEAIPWFARALAIYEKEGIGLYANMMRGELGCCHFAIHEDDKAFDYFTCALDASRASGARASLHIDLANMGALHLRRGEYARAIAHFQEALQIARELGDRISVSKWLGNLALTYTQMGNPALAASFQRQVDEVTAEVELARAAAR